MSIAIRSLQLVDVIKRVQEYVSETTRVLMVYRVMNGKATSLNTYRFCIFAYCAIVM